MKGYKVTNASRSQQVGIACSSLEELKSKGCKKLKIKVFFKEVDVVLNDGTVVDDEDYFQTLPSQTVLNLRIPGEEISRRVDIFYAALKAFNSELLQTDNQARKFFTDKEVKKKVEILFKFFKDDKSPKINLSLREEDPEWFEDLETLANNKEAYMRMRSSGRIQRYFYDAKDKIQKSSPYYKNAIARNHLDAIIQNFYNQLKSDEFFACLFDRRSINRGAICDKFGMFACQGLWDCDRCLYLTDDDNYSHRINPYQSKEERVIFTTWNLDHRIERSRTIVPSILQASLICTKDRNYRINSSYFYELLFTCKNLKLVHIVCHDKSEHKTALCDLNRCVVNITTNKCIGIKNKRFGTNEIDVSQKTKQFRKSKRTVRVQD